MTDTISKEKRTWVMGRVRSKDTLPELILRGMLHRLGYRYKINDKSLPGKPDLVFPKYRSVVAIHGCFWHQHPNCKRSSIPSDNSDYWKTKLEGNTQRDKRNLAALQELGWRTYIIWECELKAEPQNVLNNLIEWLEGSKPVVEYSKSELKHIYKVAEKKRRYELNKSEKQKVR